MPEKTNFCRQIQKVQGIFMNILESFQMPIEKQGMESHSGKNS